MLEELIPDYDNDDRVSSNTIRYEILLNRLLISRLRPMETEIVGNCFFRAIAQMIYGNDNLHRVIRRRMIETIQGNHEFYQDFILHRYESMGSYIQNMSRDSEWAYTAALASAEASGKQIMLLTSIRITSQSYVQAMAGSAKELVLDLLTISIIVQRRVSMSL